MTLKLSITLATLWTLCAGSAALPNIVLFHADDMVPGHGNWSIAPTDPNGYFQAPMAVSDAGESLTPNIDAVAATGFTFSRAYVASSMCAPSRHAILTGRYPSLSEYTISKSDYGRPRVTVPYSAVVGDDKYNNVAALLRANGYRTGMFGKWHMTPGEEDGNDYSYAYEAQVAAVQERGYDLVDGLYVSNLNTCDEADCGSFSHNMEWMAGAGMEFIAAAAAASEPFFAYFNPTTPHTPSAWGSLNNFANSDTPAGPQTVTAAADGYMDSYGQVKAAVRGTSYSGLDRGVVAGVKWLDSALGALLRSLEEAGVLEDTLLIVTSDNGDAKGDLFEQGLRVPMFAKYPAITTSGAGSVVSEVVSSLDIASTVLEAAGVAANYTTFGSSWLGWLRGDAGYAQVSDAESCEAAGYRTIGDAGTCEAAAGALALPDTSSVGSAVAHLPVGCVLHKNQWLKLNAGNGGSGARCDKVNADGSTNPCLCQGKLLDREYIAAEIDYDRAIVTNEYKYLSKPQDAARANSVQTWCGESSGCAPEAVYPAYYDEEQLYDLLEDEGEQTNLAAEAPAVLATLQGYLTEHEARTNYHAPPPPQPPPSPQPSPPPPPAAVALSFECYTTYLKALATPTVEASSMIFIRAASMGSSTLSASDCADCSACAGLQLGLDTSASSTKFKPDTSADGDGAFSKGFWWGGTKDCYDFYFQAVDLTNCIASNATDYASTLADSSLNSVLVDTDTPRSDTDSDLATDTARESPAPTAAPPVGEVPTESWASGATVILRPTLLFGLVAALLRAL